MTSNINVKSIHDIVSPFVVKQQLPITNKIQIMITEWRKQVSDIINHVDKRLLVVVGPCSIHDTEAAIEYANNLKKMSDQFSDKLFIVMRVYFEKPRTTIGWKGLINDPYLNETFQINDGIRLARELLLRINKIGLPVGCEFLDVFTPQYYADLVTWGAIGARTTESQLHRQLASGLSMPIGFKNGTGGSVDIACEAVISASYPHVFLGIDEDGRASIVSTKGNKHLHIILRGGKDGPNYFSKSVKNIANMLDHYNIRSKIIVDCSHANSNKNYRNQPKVMQSIIKQLNSGQSIIGGVMIESNIKEDKQKLIDCSELEYGKSITDGCVNLKTTYQMLSKLSLVYPLESYGTHLSHRN